MTPQQGCWCSKVQTGLWRTMITLLGCWCGKVQSGLWYTMTPHHNWALVLHCIRDSADLKNKRICPWQVLWFIFNLQIEKNRSVTGIAYLVTITAHDSHLLTASSTNSRIRTWLPRRCQHCSKWVHPCSSLKADRVLLFTMCLRNAWTASHADGLAWLLLAWLAQIMLLIKVPTLNT